MCEYLKSDPSHMFVTPLAADPKTFYPCEDAAAISRLIRVIVENAPEESKRLDARQA
jgi:hypothetical protein